MMMIVVVDDGEQVSTELGATRSYQWWQHSLTCAQLALGFTHAALFNRCTDAPETG